MLAAPPRQVRQSQQVAAARSCGEAESASSLAGLSAPQLRERLAAKQAVLTERLAALDAAQPAAAEQARSCLRCQIWHPSQCSAQ
jgi:hypothetical protein